MQEMYKKNIAIIHYFLFYKSVSTLNRNKNVKQNIQNSLYSRFSIRIFYEILDYFFSESIIILADRHNIMYVNYTCLDIFINKKHKLFKCIPAEF